jgi:hypothetical protein
VFVRGPAVANAAPTITSISAPDDPVAVNTTLR